MKMKKTPFVLLLLLVSFCLMTNVVAKSTFDKTNDFNTDTTNWMEVNISNVVKLNDGYIVTEYRESDRSYSIVKKLDMKGSTIWEKEMESRPKAFANAFALDDEKIIVAIENTGVYILSTSNGEQLKSNESIEGYEIAKFNDNYIIVGYNGIYIVDSNLNELKSYYDEDYDIYAFTTDNDNIYTLGRIYDDSEEYYILTLDTNLKVLSQKVISTNDEYGYLGYQEYLAGNGDLIKKGEKLYYISFDVSEITCSSDSCTLTHILGEDFNTVEKYYNSATTFGNYTILGGEDENGHPLIEIYDYNFNLLQTINNISYNNNAFGVIKNVTATKGGFVLKGVSSCSTTSEVDLITPLDDDDDDDDDNEGDCIRSKFVQEYKIEFDITTKTDGNGEVKPSKTSAYSSEKITFTVTPNEGYKVELIIVTDSKGNTITFTDNTFTMPTDNVVIEAKFVKNIKNPNTGASLPIFSLIIMCCIGVTLLIKSKKLNRFKKI